MADDSSGLAAANSPDPVLHPGPTALRKWICSLLLAILTGFSAARCFLGFSLSHFFTEAWLWAVAIALLWLPAHLLLSRLRAFRRRFPRRMSQWWVAGSALTALLLAVATPLTLPAWLPEYHELTVVATGRKHPEAKSSEVWIQGIFYEDRMIVPPRDFERGGKWFEHSEGLFSHGTPPARASWKGRLPRGAQLRLSSHPFTGIAEVVWDGRTATFDLYSPQASLTRGRFSPGQAATVWACRVGLFLLTDLVSLACLVLTFSGWILSRPLSACAAQADRWSWLRFSVPCLVAWTFHLLAFWPAILSPDSTHQLAQLTQWRFHDLQPFVHTMSIWLIMRVWDSPAAVALVQIIALSLLIGWCLSLLRRLRVPSGVCWLLSATFAVLPPTGVMIITVWKDLPYTIAFFALSILCLKTAVTGGEWIRTRGRWLILGVVISLTALYRHNGPAPAFGTLFLLFLAYAGRSRRPLIATSLAAICLFGLARGPLLRAFDVEKHRLGLDVLLTWQIGAHLDAKTPIPDADRALLSTILPVENGTWPYNPYALRTIFFDKRFDLGALRLRSNDVRRIWWECLKQRPMVNATHMVKSASYVWRIKKPAGSFFETVMLYFADNGSVRYIAKNDLGWIERPLVNRLTRPLATWIIRSQDAGLPELVWRPALYLYWGLLGTSLFAVRFRDWRLLLPMAPAVLHSVFCALFVPSNNFRYQYPVIVTGFFLGAVCLAHVSRLAGAIGSGPGTPGSRRRDWAASAPRPGPGRVDGSPVQE